MQGGMLIPPVVPRVGRNLLWSALEIFSGKLDLLPDKNQV